MPALHWGRPSSWRRRRSRSTCWSSGPGASGMATAVTAAHHGLEVLVVEKEARYGGTTARSGGWLWIPGHPARHRARHQGAAGRGEGLSQARDHDALRREARRCFPRERPQGDRLLHPQHLRAVRHAGGVPRLSRGGTRRTAGRSLHGHAAVRWPRAGRAHQAARPAAAGAHGLRNDAGLRAGDPPFHARVQVADLVRLRDQAAEQALPRRDRAWSRHDAHQRQRARGSAWRRRRWTATSRCGCRLR